MSDRVNCRAAAYLNNGFQRTVLALRARPAAEPGRYVVYELDK